MPVITPKDVRVLYPSLTSYDDAVLTMAIGATVGALEGFLSRELELKTVTEWHPAHYAPKLFLKRPPVKCVEFVDLVLFDKCQTPSDPKNDELYLERRRSNYYGEVHHDRKYTTDVNNGTMNLLTHCSSLGGHPYAWYVVRYTGGFDPIPPALNFALCEMVYARLMSITKLGQTYPTKREKIGDYEIEYAILGSVPQTSVSASALGPAGSQIMDLVRPYIRSGVNGI